MLFQSLYIRIINWVFKKTGSINAKFKSIMLLFSCFALVLSYLLFITSNTNIPLFSKRETMILFFLAVSIIFGTKNEIKKMNIKLRIAIPYYLSAIGILVFGLLNNCHRMYIIMSLEMLFVFPCLYLVLLNNKNNEVFTYLVISYTVISNLYYLYCYYLAFNGMLNFVNGRLVASASNANNLAFFYLCSFVSSLYIICKNKSLSKILFGSLSLSISTTIIVMTQCKSAFVVIALTLICVFIYLLKQINKNNYKEKLNILIKKVTVCLIILVVIYFSRLILINIQNNNSLNNSPDVSISALTERFDFKTNNSNNSSYVRKVVWKTYLNNINITGHTPNELTSEDFPPMNILYEPHNSYIDIAYKFGIISGIMYTLWILEIGIELLFVLFEGKEKSYEMLLVLLFSIAYAFISMVDVCVTPYTSDLVLCFYIVSCYAIKK